MASPKRMEDETSTEFRRIETMVNRMMRHMPNTARHEVRAFVAKEFATRDAWDVMYCFDHEIVAKFHHSR